MQEKIERKEEIEKKTRIIGTGRFLVLNAWFYVSMLDARCELHMLPMSLFDSQSINNKEKRKASSGKLNVFVVNSQW